MDYVSSYDYDNGAKLMEHSYIGNNVEAVEFLLINDGEEVLGITSILTSGNYPDAINIVIKEIPLDELREIKLNKIITYLDDEKI
jgi:hypothetical protein